MQQYSLNGGVDNGIFPSREELKTWMISTLQHCCEVEYFLYKFGLGFKDAERPHDLGGEYSKFEPVIAIGEALQYRKKELRSTIEERIILRSVDLHRMQKHHRVWNDPKSSDEELEESATDVVLALLQDRPYNNGKHSYEDIIKKIIPQCHLYQARFIEEAVEKIQKSGRPDVEDIKDLRDFPNIGLPPTTHIGIRMITSRALREFEEKGFVLY